jgi:hypothetical protein
MEVKDKVYVGDVGTVIRMDMQESLTLLEDYCLHVKKPDGTLVTWGATPVPTPSEEWRDTVASVSGNYIEYIIQEGDLDIPGDYLIQPYGTIGIWTGSGLTATLTVHDNFD